MPELEKAQKAVEEIDRNALNTIRSYPAPPEIVKLVLEGVCILLGTKTDWATAKGLMQDLTGFIAKLLNYPKDNIPEDRLNKLKRVLAREDFNPEAIRSRAPAAADLCMWCLAMNIYSGVSKKVEPKKKKVAELQAVLDKAFKTLQEKEGELDVVKQAVARLKKETDEMLQKKMDLLKLKDLTEDRLLRAQKLITLTADEAKRWAETVQTLSFEIENLVGDVFLSAAAISYNGPFTGPYRTDLVTQWVAKVNELQIPVSENFSLIRTLGDPMQLRDWMICGLPSDTVSQENAIFAS
jgi:dynein heavy chain